MSGKIKIKMCFILPSLLNTNYNKIGGVFMESLIRSTSKVFKGSAKALERYPIVIANAVAFSIVTIIRIHMDWPKQEAYNFLFNCLHLSFALGAIFSLALITAVKSRYNDKKIFQLANILGIIVTIVTIILLYFFGGIYSDHTLMRYKSISSIATARVGVVIFVSILAFIILAEDQEEQSDFPKSFFMFHKAFIIAIIYGLVIMLGTSGVAGAVKALLYRGLSSNVYGYIGTLSGFLAFIIFVGYFPDFQKGVVDKQREIAQKQPRFIEILFGYIMIPIMLALTFVLILWTVKTIMDGMEVPFIRLSSIASSYAIGGICLYIISAHYKTDMAKFYKKTYPIAAIFILVFEAWALFVQLQKYGLKTTEYIFALIWIGTLTSAILLMLKKEKTYHFIVTTTSILAIISVTPYIGYNDFPVTSQVSRLEKLLEKEGMFKGENIVPAIKEPEENIRESITDAVEYLGSIEDARLPKWFDKDFINSENFKKTFGFEKTFPKYDNEILDNYMGTSLFLRQEVIDIKGYRWAVNMQNIYDKENEFVTLNGDEGIYRIYWQVNQQDGVPFLKILLNDEIIVDLDMNEYLDRITKKFPPGKMDKNSATLEDMSLKFETSEINIMLIFSNVEINSYSNKDEINYWINPNTLYFNEKH